MFWFFHLQQFTSLTTFKCFPKIEVASHGVCLTLTPEFFNPFQQMGYLFKSFFAHFNKYYRHCNPIMGLGILFN
jgi:ABC-type transport system involved in cytochrome bd biosynthesis fused ATPase/permease subunit